MPMVEVTEYGTKWRWKVIEPKFGDGKSAVVTPGGRSRKKKKTDEVSTVYSVSYERHWQTKF